MPETPTSVDAALIRAKRLSEAGHTAEAIAVYRAILARFPSNARAKAGLAALLQSSAAPAMLPSVEAARRALAGGQAARALDLLRPLIAHQGDNPDLHLLAGGCLAALGKHGGALKHYEIAYGLRPGWAKAWFGAGNMLALLGRPAEADCAFQAVVRADATHRDAYNNLGLMCSDLGQVDEAAEAFGAAVRLDPQNVDTLNNLGLALHGLGRLDEAARWYEAALAVRDEDARTRFNLANVWKDQGRTELAVQGYCRVLAVQSDHSDAANNLGNLLREQGDVGGSKDAYLAALEVRPNSAVLLRNFADLHRFRRDDPWIWRISEVLGGTTDAAERMYLQFALGKALDDIGDTAAAFAAFAEGNLLRKAQLGYDIAADQALFAAIRRYFGDGAAQATGAGGPIFIVGMMRSGTSLVEQILASHSAVSAGGEMETMSRLALPILAAAAGNRMTREVAAGVRAGYLAEQAFPTAIHTDKMPGNFRWIGFILAAFPEARVVHLKRDRMAVGWSIFRHFFAETGNGYAYDLADIGAYSRLHDDLMDFWHRMFPGRIHEVEYERLTEDQEGVTRALLAYCGLGWEEACLRFHETPGVVRTTSSEQVRRKMYRGSSEEWRRYEEFLEPLKQALGDEKAGRITRATIYKPL